ncbi:CPBP family intramembrane glutamic endopeptidase [Phenylobacterium sp.]|uniref:CPBP family intramembrane glutamic endopeptidase n=1 Tax=Phenylobacterium sp. TaxID=1871053 RepID=UPI0012159943|nr:CPBP family intramembrane glutamic endopeptidase [Phenylobacterium sp.]THD68175.1 MAG: CPBP family intramembrane metalloprotease [Phenylobacterium sp.]
MPIRSRAHAGPLSSPVLWLAGYLAAWGVAVGYLAQKGGDWSFPIISLGVFGVALPGLALLLTRNARPAPIPVLRPGLELAAVLVFLTVYAVVFLGWGMGAVRHAAPPGREQELLVLAAKLAVHVLAPAALLALLGAQLRPLIRARANRPGFWPPLIVLGLIILALLCVVSPALKQIAGLHASAATLAWAAPAAFIWIALEAGLCEEFLFRAVLQTRLAAVLKSEVGAVVVGALLFALAHAPGLFLRGTPETDGYSTDVFQVVAFTIATLSPIALLFGTLWARTRSLLLIVLLHAAVDVLPNLAAFVRTWTG